MKSFQTLEKKTHFLAKSHKIGEVSLGRQQWNVESEPKIMINPFTNRVYPKREHG